MRLASALLACAALSLAACDVPYPRENAGQYRQGFTERGYTLQFVPGTAEPAPDDLLALEELRGTLRRDTRVQLSASGPLATLRAARVAEVLRLPVAAELAGSSWFSGPGRDEADLVLQQPAIVADACASPPVKVGRTLWVIGDYSRQELLPPGCAVATMLLEQAADRRDLLRGRVLEPGAAGPIARAAERYLRRNDSTRSVTNEERGGAGGQGQDQREQNGQPPGPSTGQAPTAPQGAPLPAGLGTPAPSGATAPAR